MFALTLVSLLLSTNATCFDGVQRLAPCLFRQAAARQANYNPIKNVTTVSPRLSPSTEKAFSRVSEVEMAHIGNSMERAEEIATRSLPDTNECSKFSPRATRTTAPSSLQELLERLDFNHNSEMAKQSVMNPFGYQTYGQRLHTDEDVRVQALRTQGECEQQAYRNTAIEEQAARLQALRNEEGMRRLRNEEGMRRLGMCQVKLAIEKRQRLTTARAKATELLNDINVGYEGRVQGIANGRTSNYDVSNSLREDAQDSLALVKAAQVVHVSDVDALENACRVVERMGRFDQLQTRDEKYDWQYDYGYQLVGNNMTPVAVY
jgi:hypothetical protein